MDIEKQQNKWMIIENCLQKANDTIVEQPLVAGFLKDLFDQALDSLAYLIQEGIDLSDKNVVSKIMELELAIAKIPQERVRSFNVATVIEEFQEYSDRLYVYLSIPKQNAENSFSCYWVLDRFESFIQELEVINDSLDTSENALRNNKSFIDSVKGMTGKLKPLIGKLKREVDKLYDELLKERAFWEHQKDQLISKFTNNLNKNYLFVCYSLVENGSDMIKALLAKASENLAHSLSSENMVQEASLVRHLAIKVLSEENPRITQRNGRLQNVIDDALLFDVKYKEELMPAELAVFLPGFFNPATPWGGDNGFEDALIRARSIIICEIASEGSAADIAKRMILSIDNYGRNSKDIFYYVDAGNLMAAGYCDPDFSVIMHMMGERYNVLKWVCQYNPEIPGRYLRVVVGIVIPEGD